jgi:hypothetical protein
MQPVIKLDPNDGIVITINAMGIYGIYESIKAEWWHEEFNQNMGRSEGNNNTSNLSANKIVTNL